MSCNNTQIIIHIISKYTLQIYAHMFGMQIRLFVSSYDLKNVYNIAPCSNVEKPPGKIHHVSPFIFISARFAVPPVTYTHITYISAIRGAPHKSGMHKCAHYSKAKGGRRFVFIWDHTEQGRTNTVCQLAVCSTRKSIHPKTTHQMRPFCSCASCISRASEHI